MTRQNISVTLIEHICTTRLTDALCESNSDTLVRCSGMMMQVDVELELVEEDECVEMRMQVDVDIS